MKTPVKLFTSGATLFCAAVLGLQAQSTATSSQSETASEKGSKASSTDLRTTPSTDRRAQGAHDSSAHPTQPGSAAKGSQAGAASETPSSSTSSTASTDPSSSSAKSKSGSYSSSDRTAGSVSGSTSGSATGSYGASRTETSSSTSDASIRANAAGQSTNVAGSQIDAPSTTQPSSTTESSVATSTQTDTQVTTIVQQIDAQGPVVVERITTQFADVACSPENARQLVEALHGGTAVTLSADGKTATFTPTSKLGYGEAYITLALAAEALRSAGITGCATPEQWQAVLMGGPLVAAGTTTTATTRSASASSSSNFPGILALRSQGQGWGQIAQATNVQLGQVMSSARSSLNIDASSDSALTPTGRTSAEMQQARMKSGPGAIDTDTSKGAVPGHSPDRSTGKGHDNDKDKDKEQNDGKHQPDARSTGAEPASPNR